MTGILCCDDCGELFLAHGFEKNLPNDFHGLPLFKGIRNIESVDLTKRNDYSKTVMSKFVGDICASCLRKMVKNR